MNDSSTNSPLLPFQPMFLPLSSPTTMPQSDEQTNDRPHPAPSIENRLAPSYDFAEKGFRRFYQRSIDTSAIGSNDSSPTTTISTMDDSSATEPSPGSSPESPPPSSLTGGMLRLQTADDGRPFFELQKQPLPKKGRNLKNLAVNTSRSPGKGLASATLPLPSANHELQVSDSSFGFVKPHTPSKRKPSNLGLTLLTPGLSKAPLNEIKLAVPPTPSFAQTNTLRHFQSAPSLPVESESSDVVHTVHIIPTLESVLSPSYRKLRFDEEEQNFDIPLSQEEKPEAYPHGPICVYEPYIDLYLEPTVEQAREYDVVMNVANEVRNPFMTVDAEVPEEPEIRIDGGGGIQYAPKRDRILHKTSDAMAQPSSSPTTPKAGPLETGFSAQESALRPANDPEYIHVKWEHNSDIVPDLLHLVKLMDEKVKDRKRILIHCQCGVSRSASLVVAYGLYKEPSLSVQEAYDAVKSRSKWIGPNMNLIMQLQEFRTSLTRGGLLSTNRGVTPISPSSAFSDWRGPLATTSGQSSTTQSTVTAPLIRAQTAEPLPMMMTSGPSSAPSGVTSIPIPDLLLTRARAVSSAAVPLSPPVTTFVSPSGRIVPVLKIPNASMRKPASAVEMTFPHINTGTESTLSEPPTLVKKLSTEDFAMTPLQPSPEVDPADSFGLMSPTTTEFAHSPFDRSALLANLGMGPIGTQDDLGPRRSLSLRSRHLHPREGSFTMNTPASRLRGKISSPNLGEQRRLQELQAEIAATLPNRAAQPSTSSYSSAMDDDLLMSPRATEFTQNPFALALGEAAPNPPLHLHHHHQPPVSESDPRSPPIHGGSPITRNILDVL